MTKPQDLTWGNRQVLCSLGEAICDSALFHSAFLFFAIKASTRIKTAQTPVAIIVECVILPIPTNGETIPPKRKPVDPKMAEALPIYSLPSDIARVVEEVKIMPVLVRISMFAPS